jgi:Cytochrome P460
MFTGWRMLAGGIMKRTRSYWQSIVIVAFAAVGTLFAAPTGDALKIPGDFKHWYLVHSTLITKDDNKFGLIPGVHLIYVNAAGLDRLKRGGSTPYPDGTMFTDDVRDFSAVDGTYLEGAARKAITLMVKDSKKYVSTGGWGFQAWAGGDSTKPIATDSVKQCFNCHVPQKAQDFTFAKYLE